MHFVKTRVEVKIFIDALTAYRLSTNVIQSKPLNLQHRCLISRANQQTWNKMTYIRSGLYLWISAQKANPLLKEVVMLVMATSR